MQKLCRKIFKKEVATPYGTIHGSSFKTNTALHDAVRIKQLVC